MKLISLNVYGGYFFESFLSFVKENISDTDFFCFQEILNTPEKLPTGAAPYLRTFSELENILLGFTGFFFPAQDNYEPIANGKSEASCGLAIFVNKKIAIHGKGDFFIRNQRNSFISPDIATFPNNVGYVQLNIGGKILTICNVYGTSTPGDKLDTPERLLQSQKILDFISNQLGEKIIVGDFNLLPDTRSINVFEEAGFRNLIKEFDISTTRGSLIKKMKPELGVGEYGWQEFADYTFVSSGINPLQFSVPDLPISDHLPMVLEFAT